MFEGEANDARVTVRRIGERGNVAMGLHRCERKGLIQVEAHSVSAVEVGVEEKGVQAVVQEAIHLGRKGSSRAGRSRHDNRVADVAFRSTRVVCLHISASVFKIK